MIIRKSLMEKIRDYVERGINVIIIGKRGVGKTYVLLYLKEKIENSIYLPIPYFSKTFIEDVTEKSYRNFIEAIEGLLKYSKFKVWLIDNYEYSRKIDRLIIKELAKKYKVVISTTDLINLDVNKDFIVIKLNNFNIFESYLLIGNIIDVNNFIKIFKLSRGNPYLLIKYAKILKKAGNIPKDMISSINQINIKVFLVFILALAYLLLSLRYVFVKLKVFNIFLIFSIVAYLLLFLYRVIRGNLIG